MAVAVEFGAPSGRGVKNLSPSKVEAYLNCPEQFRLRYIEKVPEKSSMYLTSGSVVHAAIEHALRAKILRGKPPELDELESVFENQWDSLVARESHKTGFMGWSYGDEDPAEMKAECKALVPLFAREILPTAKPKLVEYDVKYDYPSKYGPFMVWGKLDVMMEDGEVWDWKTTKFVSGRAVKSRIQFPHYSIFASKETGVKVTTAKKVFLIRGPEPQVRVVKYKITGQERADYAKTAAGVWEGVVEGKFEPNPKSHLCKPAYCPFYGPCMGEND